jgi:hypothetical protein
VNSVGKYRFIVTVEIDTPEAVVSLDRDIERWNEADRIPALDEAMSEWNWDQLVEASNQGYVEPEVTGFDFAR